MENIGDELNRQGRGYFQAWMEVIRNRDGNITRKAAAKEFYSYYEEYELNPRASRLPTRIYVLDPDIRTLTRIPSNDVIDLTPVYTAIVLSLARNPSLSVTNQDMLMVYRELYQERYKLRFNPDNVRVYISSLRGKIDDKRGADGRFQVIEKGSARESYKLSESCLINIVYNPATESPVSSG